MAFPVTGVLDNFNSGANQALTSRTGWGATGIRQFIGNWGTTDSVPTEAVGNGVGSGDNYWNATAADSEAWYKIGSVAPSFGQHGPAVRIQNPSAAGCSCYLIYTGAGASTDFQIWKINSGVFTAIGTNTTVTISVGDSIGISVVGSTILAFYKSGAGAWVQKDSATDSSITGSGFVSGVINDSGVAWRMTDFGGGALVSGTDWTTAGVSRLGSSTGIVSPLDVFTPVEFAPRRSSIRRS